MSQAYEILSDPEKRKVYDQYGLEFLLRGGQEAPPPGAGGPGGMPGMGGMPGGFNMGGMPGGARTFHFSTGSGGAGGFNFSNPEDIFSSFFKGGGANMGDDDDIFAQFGGGGRTFGGSGGMRNGRFGSTNEGPKQRAATPEVTVVERNLPITLEQLYKGTKKKMNIKRKTFDESTGKRKMEEKMLEIDVKPGYKAGTKIKFKGWGDQEDGATQDLHFVVTEVSSPRHCTGRMVMSLTNLQQKDHPTFKREGDDLRAIVEIDLKEALTGWRRTVPTIDGKQVQVSGGGPTPPGYEIRYPEQGMPKSKKPGERGDMIVQIQVKFPTSLTPAQKNQLKEIL